MSNTPIPSVVPTQKKLTKKKNKKKNIENVVIKNIKNPPPSIPIPLMRIPITIFSINAQALVDTGAAASFVSVKLLKKITNNKIKEKIRFRL